MYDSSLENHRYCFRKMCSLSPINRGRQGSGFEGGKLAKAQCPKYRGIGGRKVGRKPSIKARVG